MIFSRNRCIGLVFMLVIQMATAADWWESNALSMPARPESGSTVIQNPPLLSWPVRYAAGAYEVEVVGGQSGRRSYRNKDNWLHLKAPLPAGNYRWKVRALKVGGSPDTSWSDERSFLVQADQEVFLVPDPDDLWSKALQTQHPRGMPHGEEMAQLKKSAFQKDGALDFQGLRTRLIKITASALPKEPNQRFEMMVAGAIKASAMGAIRNALQDEEDSIRGLSLLWQVERNPIWLEEGKRRSLNLARWDPEGSTGLVSHNQATRTIMLSLAFAYDSFFDSWTTSEKQLLINSIHRRFSALQSAIVANFSLAKNPHNPWASYTLGYLVATAPLVAEAMPEAKAWFASSFNLYTAVFPAWSGDDGGYANGTAYGVWDVPESIKLWDTLLWSTGFDIYRKPSIRNFGRFMTYFLPPGSPEGVFGDGAEVRMTSSISRYGKSFAGRVQSPLVNWYAKQLIGEDRSALAMLTSPPHESNAAPFPADSPNSILFPSIGWAALHSDLADRSRVSVYFKSSPYGSFNHSHADQNSFVIHAHGRVVAMDSGVYDYYNSPHWRDWYKQTRAHNAITFDGGQGQGLGEAGLGSKELNGKIEKFTTTADYDLVVGDATVAYQGALTKAKRWVALVRPNTVVVVDQLSASTPRRWEWNYHTTSKPSLANGVLTYNAEGVSTCVRTSSPKELNYTQSEGYAPPPQTKAPYASHFGNRFSYPAPATEGLFISVISVDCAGTPPTVDWVGKVATVHANGKQLSFSGTEVFIQ